jgi:hypothetical protein
MSLRHHTYSALVSLPRAVPPGRQLRTAAVLMRAQVGDRASPGFHGPVRSPAWRRIAPARLWEREAPARLSDRGTGPPAPQSLGAPGFRGGLTWVRLHARPPGPLSLQQPGEHGGLADASGFAGLQVAEELLVLLVAAVVATNLRVVGDELGALDPFGLRVLDQVVERPSSRSCAHRLRIQTTAPATSSRQRRLLFPGIASWIVRPVRDRTWPESVVNAGQPENDSGR